jgi:serine phosphatase RsbU (regulator of sigma subunit)
MATRLFFCISFLYCFSFQAQDINAINVKTGSLRTVPEKINYLFATYNQTESQEISDHCFSELKAIILKSRSLENEHADLRKTLASIYNDIGFGYSYNGKTDSALLYYNKSKLLRLKLADSAGLANNYVNIGFVYQSTAKYDQALEYYQKAIPLYVSQRKFSELAGNYNNIASLHNVKGNIKACIENLMTALEYYTKIDDKKGIAWIYNSLGYVYAHQDEKKLAADWYDKALKLSLQQDNKEALALIYNNLGTLEQSKMNLEAALGYYLKALKLRKVLKDIRGEIMSLNNIGNAFILSKNFQRAELYLNDCKSKCVSINSIDGLTRCYINLASLYETWNKPNVAKIFADSAYALSKNTRNIDHLMEATKRAYKVEKMLGNDKRSLFYLEESLALQDSMKTREIQKEIYKKQYEYDMAKQEQAFEFQKKEKEIEVAQQKKVRNIFIFSLIGAVICGVLITRNLFQSKNKNKIISAQKDFIEDKQKEILDSITYAKRLQSAILPNENTIRIYLKDSFVFYRPKDIVAGDFYWFEKVGDMIFMAAADSTGHGVPGAMVSIVCCNALNKAVKEFSLTDPGQILDKTRELVLETFAKSGEEIKDGMDISLVVIHHDQLKSSNKSFRWAGANNALWYISNGQLHEVKADKQPIGNYEHASAFTTHELSVTEGTIIYLFTDGFADQFGGPKAKKFKHKQLAALLLEMKDKAMHEHPLILEKRLKEWQGQLEQIDDITILGSRL